LTATRRDRERDRAEALRARARLAALVIIVAFLLWMAANWIGGSVGLPVGLALALDLACLAALGWALVTLIGIWRARRDEGH
jgi:Na+/pantothenate symporter